MKIFHHLRKAGYCGILMTAVFSCTKKNVSTDSNFQEPGSLPEVTKTEASPPGDVVGKVIVGYQGWFAANGDGSPINVWWHWAQNWGQLPSHTNKGIKAWPDVREYTTTFQTGYSNLGNGQQARLYSNWTQQTVNTHFLWMQQNGIDGAALQRFNPNTSEGPTRDGVTTRVRTAAETYGRKFYIMYDVTGWTNMQSEVKTDWTNKMSAFTSSSAYARQNGKPVVCIWGFGFNDNNHNFTTTQCLDVINWFKGQGCYVIGGVPREWRTGVGGSRAGFIGVYHAFNMLSPWLIGAVGSTGDADNIYNNFMVGDQSDCNSNGVDYQPCVLPGDVSVPGQRQHGELMWRMFYNAKRAGVQGIYISMYDEYNEGNQIAKTAENASMIPAGSGYKGLDEDGTAVSSDYYLRLTGDGGKMLKGTIGLTPTRPTPFFVSGGSGVTFYQDVNYGGSASQVLPVGNYTLSQLAARGMPNDWASSVRVPSGRTLIMYADDNFTGTSWTRTADTPNFTTLAPNANDQVSSVRVQ